MDSDLKTVKNVTIDIVSNGFTVTTYVFGGCIPGEKRVAKTIDEACAIARQMLDGGTMSENAPPGGPPFSLNASAQAAVADSVAEASMESKDLKLRVIELDSRLSEIDAFIRGLIPSLTNKLPGEGGVS